MSVLLNANLKGVLGPGLVVVIEAGGPTFWYDTIDAGHVWMDTPEGRKEIHVSPPVSQERAMYARMLIRTCKNPGQPTDVSPWVPRGYRVQLKGEYTVPPPQAWRVQPKIPPI